MSSVLSNEDLASVLEDLFPGKTVEIWDTGGGVRNCVLILTKHEELKEKIKGFEKGAAVRYLMFSDEWHSDEASCGFYDERIMDGDTVANWWGPTKADDVPFNPTGIRAVCDAVIEVAERAIQMYGTVDPFETQIVEGIDKYTQNPKKK